MTAASWAARKCQSASCGLRFPAEYDSVRAETCPLCEAPTEIGDSYDLAALSQTQAQPTVRLVGVLDNLRSALNVGTIFRTADGLGMPHLHLCGFTPTPENPKVAKTSLGAEHTVAWDYHADGHDVIEQLHGDGYRIVAVEVGGRSQPIHDLGRSPERPIAMVVGHEVAGIDPAILERADDVVHIPMSGTKTSLNVAIAFALAAWHLR